MENIHKIFWSYKSHNGGYKLEIDTYRFIGFLEENGFGNFILGRTRFFVRLEKKIMKQVESHQINLFAKEYLRALPNDIFEHGFTIENLIDQFHIRLSSLVHREQLFTLKNIEPNFKKDTKGSSFKFFKNGYIEITNSEIKCFDYKDLDGVIWDYQIINRNFELLSIKEFSEQNHFYSFLWNCMGQNVERLNSLMSILGYLMHTYKDPTTAKLVVLCDERISDEPNGGSGKSLTIKAVSIFVKTANEDGKTFNAKSSFAFQQVDFDTKLVFIDDVLKNFNMEPLFSPITGGIVIERKYKNKLFVSGEDSPKFVITTNYMVQGTGLSFERRKIEIEFSDYYNKARTPDLEFGHRFFDDWKEEQWLKFDNMMLFFIQYYIANGLVKSAEININKRKLIQETNSDFIEFVDTLPRNVELNKTSEFNRFISRYPEYQYTHQRVFTKWLQIYADLKEGIDKIDESHSDLHRYFRLVTK